ARDRPLARRRRQRSDPGSARRHGQRSDDHAHRPADRSALISTLPSVLRRPYSIVALAGVLAALIAGADTLGAGRASVAAAPALRDWPEFGLNPQRTSATGEATGIDAAAVQHLRLRSVALPGTADN